MTASFPDLDGRHVLVTGGSNGIGATLCVEFAKQGCHVTLLDIDPAGGKSVRDECRRLGSNAELVEVDLRDAARLADVLDEIVEARPPVDVLVANAGLDPRATELEMSADEWDSLFQLNVTHYFMVCKKLLPAMKARGRGSIIMTASHTAWLGKPELIAYNATKSAIVGLCRSLAEAVGRYGIRVNAVAPGWTMTERQLATWASPEDRKRTVEEDQLLPIELTPAELAGTYLFLASDASRPLTRQILCADAGQSKH